MSSRVLYQSCCAIAALMLVGCYFATGWRGAAGFALGFLVSAFGLIVWWQVISLIGSLARSEAQPKRGTALVVTAFLVKLPLFIAAVFIASSFGGAARPCFAMGLCLVYLCLVGRLFTDGAAQPS